jgi:hypothetical protein
MAASCFFSTQQQQINASKSDLDASFNNFYVHNAERINNCSICDESLELIQNIDNAVDDHHNFMYRTTCLLNDRVNTLEKDILYLKTENAQLNTEINNIKYEKEKDRETQKFLVVTADITHKICDKIKYHIKSSPEYRAEYGRFWQNDFWKDVKHGDPLAGKLYTTALAAYAIDKADYEHIVRLKDCRNATYHTGAPLETPAEATAALDLLQNQIPRIATEENKAIIAILRKYVRVL